MLSLASENQYEKDSAHILQAHMLETLSPFYWTNFYENHEISTKSYILHALSVIPYQIHLKFHQFTFEIENENNQKSS